MRGYAASLLGAVLALGLCAGDVGARSSTNHGESPFRLEITIEKDSFLLGEPVWVDVELVNSTPDTAVLPLLPFCLACRSFDFRVRRDGQALPYSGPRATWVVIPKTVNPNEVLREEFDLLVSYGETVDGAQEHERVLAPGTYTVQAWQTGLLSNELEFVVVEPHGRDAEIYEAMVEALRLKARSKTSEASARLEALLPQLADSPYREKIYFLIARLWLFDWDKHMAACQRLLQVGLDSHYAPYAVFKLMRPMNRQEAEAFLQDLEQVGHDTRASRAAAEAVAKGWFSE